MKIQDPNQPITFVNGKRMNPNIEVSFYLILAGILATLLFSEGFERFIGLLFLPIGLVPFFTKWGTDIQLSSKNYRHYRSIYGLSWGSWKSYAPFSDIVIQTNRYSGLAQSRTGITTEVSDIRTEVFFMTTDHRHKVLVALAKNVKEAHLIAAELSSQTNMPIKKFNPVRINRIRR